MASTPTCFSRVYCFVLFFSAGRKYRLVRSRICFAEDDFGESFPPKQKPKGVSTVAIGCSDPDPKELALSAFRKISGFSAVQKGSVDVVWCGRERGECGSEKFTCRLHTRGRAGRVWQWGLLDYWNI